MAWLEQWRFAMKRFLVPLAAALIVIGSGPSWAWSHVSGSITSIDPSAHQIVLDNGRTYTLQSGISLSKLTVGDKVTVNTETKGKQHLVNKLTKA
jgi:hypothetical protein